MMFVKLCMSSLLGIVIVLCNCIEVDKLIKYNWGFRFGPVLLKVDKDWIQKSEKENFIRLGFNNKFIAPKFITENEYSLVSPKRLSFKTVDTLILEGEKPSPSTSSIEINVYDIPLTNKQLWIDLYLAFYYIQLEKGKYRTEIQDCKGLYFYHPKIKKWWGLYSSNTSNVIYSIMYNNLYNTNNTKQDIEKMLMKIVNRDKYTLSEITSNRIFNLSSMKFYEEKFGDLIQKYKLFCWYVEKEEVAPKDSDE